MTPVLEFDQIQYAYPGCPESLSGISFTVKKGARVALVGPNGAGKTTLLLMSNGVLEPRKGRVLLDGEPLRYDSRSLREIRKKVGLVFQNSDTQLFAPTVYQDVAFGPLNLGMSQEEIRAAVTRSLAAVGLTGYEKRPPHQLSGGEKKRAAIAGVLAMDPEVLVFDEPTSSLDPAGAAELMELLDELNAQGKTIIISTHDVELAYQWADHVVLLRKGSVVSQGPPEEIFTRADLVATTSLRAPAIVEMYMELSARKMLSGNRVPRSVLQLVKCFEHSARHEKHPSEYGTITVCNVDDCNLTDILSHISTNPEARTGAMGTRAKTLAEQEKISLDFTYGVIDKCILRALIGESSVILTIREMVPRIEKRVRDYGKESGNPLVLISFAPGKAPMADKVIRERENLNS